MKRLLQINLCNNQFAIDHDAYEKLESYFASLEKHFEQNENADEIIYDIECRLAELFNENLTKGSVLTIRDIEKAISVMGRPEDFGDLEEDAEAKSEERPFSFGQQNKTEDKRSSFKPGKKLFKDPENKVIDGVCSGLAAYFGIADPVWIRLAMVFLVFFGGMSVIVYIVLMIVIPKAVTPADRKAMYGEPIDINDIASSVETEIESLSDRIQNWADSFREKREQKRKYKHYKKF